MKNLTPEAIILTRMNLMGNSAGGTKNLQARFGQIKASVIEGRGQVFWTDNFGDLNQQFDSFVGDLVGQAKLTGEQANATEKNVGTEVVDRQQPFFVNEDKDSVQTVAQQVDQASGRNVGHAESLQVSLGDTITNYVAEAGRRIGAMRNPAVGVTDTEVVQVLDQLENFVSKYVGGTEWGDKVKTQLESLVVAVSGKKGEVGKKVEEIHKKVLEWEKSSPQVAENE